MKESVPNKNQRLIVDFVATGLEEEQQMSDEENERKRLRMDYLEQKQQRLNREQQQKLLKYGPSSSSSESMQIEIKRQDLPNKFALDCMSNSSDEGLPVYVPKNKSRKEWKLQSLKIQDDGLLVASRNYSFANYTKIKASKGEVVKDCAALKLTLKKEELVLGLSLCQKLGGLPLHYYVFAFILRQKIKQLRIKEEKFIQFNVLNIPESMRKDCLICGKIMKKSQNLGVWKERKIVVTADGIYSYKDEEQCPSMVIKGSSIRELWTRFQIYNDFLIIKIMYETSTKTELAIPITYLLEPKCWLYHIYCLIFKTK